MFNKKGCVRKAVWSFRRKKERRFKVAKKQRPDGKEVNKVDKPQGPTEGKGMAKAPLGNTLENSQKGGS